MVFKDVIVMKFWVTLGNGNRIWTRSPLGHYFKFSQGQQQPKVVSDLCEISWRSPLYASWTLAKIKKAPSLLSILAAMKELNGHEGCTPFWMVDVMLVGRTETCWEDKVEILLATVPFTVPIYVNNVVEALCKIRWFFF